MLEGQISAGLMDSAVIASRRRALGLSQRGLARDLGVHSSTVSRWERAKHCPRGSNRAKLIAKFGAVRPRLTIAPYTLRDANAYVQKWHRHHGRVAGAKFSLAVRDTDQIRGVAIVGRPVARHLDDGHMLEVTRVATDGVPNGCSPYTVRHGERLARWGTGVSSPTSSRASLAHPYVLPTSNFSQRQGTSVVLPLAATSPAPADG